MSATIPTGDDQSPRHTWSETLTMFNDLSQLAQATTEALYQSGLCLFQQKREAEASKVQRMLSEMTTINQKIANEHAGLVARQHSEIVSPDDYQNQLNIYGRLSVLLKEVNQRTTSLQEIIGE